MENAYHESRFGNNFPQCNLLYLILGTAFPFYSRRLCVSAVLSPEDFVLQSLKIPLIETHICTSGAGRTRGSFKNAPFLLKRFSNSFIVFTIWESVMVIVFQTV